ncbi:MAG: GNAT family N-acetyltransferase, partial [Chloroflexi bacterium]|nr:GNAT family N-acetyltransferase [Chloroflexota bacterium]
MPFDIRTIEPAETGAWFESVMTAFLDRSDADAIAAEVVPLWDYRRVWAAFESDTIVGTARSWATELTVPGGVQLPGSAIAGVTVRPTHRRQGILSGLMATELDAARDRGEAVAMLYASEYPIYGRFGFGPAVPTATWTVSAAEARLPGSAPPGTITFEPPSIATRDEVRRIFHAARARQPGEIWRREFTWDQDLGLRTTTWGPTWKGFVAVHRDPSGTPDGYVRYHVDDKWEQRQPRNVLQVDELLALGDEAYAD